MATDPLHIALANYESPPNAGGGGEFTASLAGELNETHVVEVCAGERDGQASSLGHLASWPVRRGADLRCVANRADVLNCHFSVPTSLLAPVLSPRTPLVVNCMGADIYDPTRYRTLRPVLDLLNKWVRLGADRLVVPSVDMYERLSRRAQNITEVIPYFVDAERYAPGESYQRRHKPVRLLTVSRLVKRKRLERPIDCLQELDNRGVDTELTIVGSGPDENRLQSLARDAGVSDQITFAGYVSDDDLPKTYREHDIYCMPSEHEAFGISCVEALASGLPAIVTDTGGHAEVPGDGGIVTRGDPVQLADAVERIMREYRDYSTAARERVMDNYTAAQVVPQYEQLYHEVL